MTEPKEVAWPEGTITFRGRKIRVAMPSPEQIMVWQRTLAKLEGVKTSDWTGKEVMSALERTRKIIDTVMLDSTDVDWLDDEMLAGRVGMKEASEILLEAQKAFMKPAKKAPAKKAPAKRAPAKNTASKSTKEG